MCRRHGLAVSQVYTWEKRARQGALEALRNGKRGRKRADPEAQLQAQIESPQAVVAELSAENPLG